MVSALLDRGADPNSLDKAGNSALAVACMGAKGDHPGAAAVAAAARQQPVPAAEGSVDVARTVHVLSTAGGRVLLPTGRSSPTQLLAQYNPTVRLVF